MDPVTLVLVPGILGGALIAIALFLTQRRRAGSPTFSIPFDNQPRSTDVINAAHIKVAGIGGLGLVAMAAVVALNVPRIGQTLAIGLALGAVLAGALILRRRSG